MENLFERSNNKRNIEIKAKLNETDINFIKKEINSLTKNKEIVSQVDTYFDGVKDARLKLRELNDFSELIYYVRADEKGPKLCNYIRCEINSGQLMKLKTMLSMSYGIRGVVKKIREIYIVDQTRIHIDSVDNLGSFVELEVVLNEDQNIEEGEQIANQFLDLLKISKENLLNGSYIDLIEQIQKQ